MPPTFLTAPRGLLPRGRQRGGPWRGRDGFLGASPETSRARSIPGDQPPRLTPGFVFKICILGSHSRVHHTPSSMARNYQRLFYSGHWSSPVFPRPPCLPAKGATGRCLVDVLEYITNFEKHGTVGFSFLSIVSVVSTFCCAIELPFPAVFLQQCALEICPAGCRFGRRGFSASDACTGLQSARPFTCPRPLARGRR